MARMTLLWVVTYFAGLTASFVNPLFGTLTYLFEYYLRPSFHWWGRSLPDLRWNFMIAAVLTATYVLRRSSLPDAGAPRRGPTLCVALLGGYMLLMTPFAARPDLSFEKTTQFLKMALFHGLVIGTVRTEAAFDAFVAVHMAGAGWWGWEAYRNPRRTAGRLANVGSGDTRGDNGAAAHLLTVLPFAVAYLLLHRDKRLRALALLVTPFVVNTIILCNSRGAVLALIVCGLTAVWLARPGHRIRMLAVGFVAAAGFLYLADPIFIARQATTTRFQEDGSAAGRLEAWRGAVDLVRDHPLGAGGQGFWELSPVYAPELVERLGEKRDPHNTFVLVASEWGLPGLALFLGYYLTSFHLLRQVRRRAREGGIWYYRSVAIHLSLVALLVAGSFTDRLYAEAPLWMGALAVALHRLQARSLSAGAEVPHARSDSRLVVASPRPLPVARAAERLQGLR